jgi:hypothetical protein
MNGVATMSSKWIKRSLCAVVMAAITLPALADRPFPSNAQRGTMTLGYFPAITLNGVARQLAAGARIFNRRNTIDMPASITGTNIVVNYTEDGTGYIDRVWILTREEAAQDLPTMDAALAAAQAAAAAAQAAAAQAAAAAAAAKAAAATSQ